MFHKRVLANGLTIIEIPQKNTQTVTFLVLARTGLKYEKKEVNGISHLLEHLTFKGTLKRPDKISIVEPLDRVGGSYNAFTGAEYTGYYAKVEKSHLDLALDVVSDIYLNSIFEKKEMEKEKNVIIEEINMYFDHPSYHVQSLWSEVLYGDQPAGRLISGTKESVKNIRRKDILDYFSKQYVAKNTIVVISGNFKNIKKKVEKSFSNIKNGPVIEKEKTEESQRKPEMILNYRKTDQTHLCLGVRAFDIFSSKKYSLELMAALLGGMMSSRLFLTIREKLGLVYYVKTDYDKDSDTGSLVTQVGVDNSKVEKAISAILKEYKKLTREKISSLEFKKAKERLKGSLVLGLETSDSRAVFYGTQEAVKKEVLTPKQICAKIDSVKAKDILETAKEVFQPKNLNLALVGPFKDKKKFEKILKI